MGTAHHSAHNTLLMVGQKHEVVSNLRKTGFQGDEEMKNILTVLIITVFMALPALSGAVDYNSCSLAELSAMRGSMQGAGTEERNTFRDAWRTRMHSASPEDRAAYRGQGWQGKHHADGSGSGSMNRYGKKSGKKNQGSGNGQCDGSGGHGRGGRGR